MSDRKHRQSAEYQVGYRRPPKASRFQPGKSGNPRGRPKGNRSVASILNGILREKIAVSEGGKMKRMATLEVMLRRLVNDAMKSEPQALKLLLTLVDRYADAAQETDLPTGDMLAEDKAILVQYLQGAEDWLRADGAVPDDQPGYQLRTRRDDRCQTAKSRGRSPS